jgi:hypothetical protein
MEDLLMNWWDHDPRPTGARGATARIADAKGVGEDGLNSFKFYNWAMV